MWVPKTLQSRLAALSFLLQGSAFRFSGCGGRCSWCLRDVIRLFGGSDTQAAAVVLYSLLDGLRRQTSWPAQLHEATAGNHGSGYLPILRCDDVRSGWGNTDLASGHHSREWELNPRAYRLLSPHGATVGPLFLLLSTTMVAAGVGWSRGRYWGWVLAVAIVTSQVLGDLVNLLRGDFVRGSIGFAIAGALLMYLLSSKVRSFFAAPQSTSP